MNEMTQPDIAFLYKNEREEWRKIFFPEYDGEYRKNKRYIARNPDLLRMVAHGVFLAIHPVHSEISA